MRLSSWSRLVALAMGALTPSRAISQASATSASAALWAEAIQGFERFFQRRQPVPFVHLVEVDVIGAQPAQARLALLDQMMPGQAPVIGSGADRHPDLGGDQGALAAPALEDFAKHFLRRPIGIHIRRVEQVHAMIERDIHLAGRCLNAGRSGSGEEALAAEGHRAKSERRDEQARAS